LRTPGRSYADAWPVVFLAFTIWIHSLTVYFLFTLLAEKQMAPSTALKGVGFVSIVLLILLFFWHYVLKRNGARVITLFEKRGNEVKYVRMGALIFAETLLLPLALSCLLILWSKLKGV
jgi:hypothetical protein